jgi:DmsE family decaheme c-type cytochrome
MVRPCGASILAVGLMGFLVVAGTACRSSQEATRRTDPYQEAGAPKPNNFFHQVSYQPVSAAIPVVQGAEYVNDDELCAQCHPGYAKSFAANNVHRQDGCEACHGPGSRHLETRGKEAGMLLNFKTADAVVRAEACLKCHEENACTPGTRWRTSKHAQCGVTCVDCHRGHYDVPAGTPATVESTETASRAPLPDVALAAYQQAGKGPGPGYVKPKKSLPSLAGSPNPMGAASPGTCYRCHCDMREFQQIAGPHQICGPNGFNCTTCHDAHGQIREETRRDMCLQCHSDSTPAMAWHSSTHAQYGVACTDCHNPHPRTQIQQMVNISHTDVRRPKRLQMSVQDPETCYKCHPKMFGLNSLPSHHPIKEGKMVCGDCHDAHGQYEANLKEVSINMVCYKCHADKQGPFTQEHPPVTENCGYCHSPHGAVADKMLRQPPPFLCLRCHSGHRGSHGNGARTGIDNKPWLIGALYTNCTQCHHRIHGSDLTAGGGSPFSRD